MQAFFAATHDKNISMGTPEEEADWKAKKDVIDKEVRALKKQMKGLEGEALAKMEKRIEDAEDRVPPPPPALFSVTDDYSKISTINVLARGDYQNKGVQVERYDRGHNVNPAPRADQALYIKSEQRYRQDHAS